MNIQNILNQLHNLKNQRGLNSFEKAIVATYDKLYGSLTEKQQEILYDTSKFKIVQGVRQSGKSRLLNTIALLTTMFIPDKTVFLGSFKESATKYNLQNMKELYYSLPEEGKPSVITWNQNKIEFVNHSTIYTGAVTPYSTRGLGIDLLILDEIAFCNNMNVKDFWDSNFPIMKHRGEVIIASTRANRSKKNFFWNTWVGAGEGFNDFKRFALASKDCTFSNRRAAEWKKNLGRARYEHEHIIRWS